MNNPILNSKNKPTLGNKFIKLVTAKNEETSIENHKFELFQQLIELKR